MSYRYYTYEMPYGFVSIDSTKEDEPEGYTNKFPITFEEYKKIRANEGAIYVDEGELIITEPIAPLVLMEEPE